MSRGRGCRVAGRAVPASLSGRHLIRHKWAQPLRNPFRRLRPRPRLAYGHAHLPPATRGASVIRFDNVSKVYPKQTRPALRDVSLEVEKGTFWDPGAFFCTEQSARRVTRMTYDRLVCANCAAPVSEGRCPVCRANRERLQQENHFAGLNPMTLIALLAVLIAAVALLAHQTA